MTEFNQITLKKLSIFPSPVASLKMKTKKELLSLSFVSSHLYNTNG
jgi:hypothetical protein